MIKHYHADNGRFAEKTFTDHCHNQGQTIWFSGVNAHFQNGVAERRIKHLQDHARTMIIHAKHRWNKGISTHLWPYAVSMANDIHMNMPLQSGKAPIELFSKVATPPKMHHYQPFGCPLCSQRQDANWSEGFQVV